MLPQDFVSGYQWYTDALPQLIETIPRIVVTALVDGVEILALLDTGANYCIVEWKIGQQLMSAGSYSVPQERALGGNVHLGHFFPAVVEFLADEGVPISIATSVWTAETFQGPNLVGYGGLLEKMRFALDPAENRFYFGA
jgi:hypothetical protein